MIRRCWTGDFATIARHLRALSEVQQAQQDQLDEQRRWWAAIGIPRRREKTDTGYFVDRDYLHELMEDAFGNADIIGLCFSLGVDWQNLGGENKSLKIWSLIEYFEQRSQLYKLLDKCRKLRPEREWPLI